MEPAEQILDELRQPVRELRERIPGVFDGYGAISAGIFGEVRTTDGRPKRAFS